MLKKGIDKKVLNNVVRHVNSHNKVQEEQLMWKQHVQQKRDSGDDSATHSPRHSRRTASGRDGESEGEESRTYWRRKLHQAEQLKADSWGHAGFADLYPEDFAGKAEKRKHHHSSSDEDSDSESVERQQKRRKVTSQKKAKKKKEKKKKEKKKKKKEEKSRHR